MSKMAAFWKLLEARPGRKAVMAEWRDVCGDALPAIRPLLLPVDRPATRYPNPRPDDWPMKVVHHRDGSIVAIDERDWQNRLELKPKDVILYQLDLRQLRKAICGSLDGVNIAKTPVSQMAWHLQIGLWEPKKAASFPVYLLLCPGRDAFRREALGLMASSTRPGAIFLTPTRTNWTGELTDTLHARNILLVPLCEVLDVLEGIFSETAAWEEYLQAFCQMVKLTLPGNYRNKKPTPRRASLSAKVEKVKKALVEYTRSARDYGFAGIDAGRGFQQLPFLTKKRLAKLAGLQPHHITRCFRADPQLKELYQIANDAEEVIKYGRR